MDEKESDGVLDAPQVLQPPQPKPPQPTAAVPRVEDACATLQEAAQNALESARSLAAVGKKLLAAAKEGRVRDFRAIAGPFVSLTEHVKEQAELISSVAALECEAVLSSESFTEEIRAAARECGLTLHAEGPLLYCFPHVIRILPGEGAVMIGRKREHRVRPKALIERLRAQQRRPVRFKPQQFLQLLYRAYLLAVPSDIQAESPEFVVPLSRVWEILTLFPGTSKEYGLEDFSRDVYLLDRSGVSSTRNGASVSFSASTGTRSSQGSLNVVTETGSQIRYWGISFSRGGDAS